jgi:hypothetical protein
METGNLPLTIGNLHGAFGRRGHAHPTEHDIPFPDVISSVTEQPFRELNSAIGAKFSSAILDRSGYMFSRRDALWPYPLPGS